MKKKQRRKLKSRGPHTPLEGHHREGKLLHPPFQRLRNTRFASWIHTRFPDQLWTSLLVTQLDRGFGVEILRTVAKACQGEFKPGIDLDLTHTGVASMSEDLASRIINLVCSAPGAPRALEPLLLFDDLPGRQRWAPHLPSGVDLSAWSRLADTVARVLDHQSQESTDARWARVLFRVATGQMVLQTKEQFLWLAEYPREGDQRAVRPFIRAAEIVEYPEHDYTARDHWAQSFWRQCLDRTECRDFLKLDVRLPQPGTDRNRVSAALNHLAETARATATTSAADARHGAAFGLTAYALNILAELLGIGVSQSILGRLGLRAILEAFVTLSYLRSKDDASLWESYRAYGQGQAKLAMLKMGQFLDAPRFVTADLLEQLASEDRGPEFLSINLGHWASADLRRLSDSAGVKEVYDRIYPWTSAFVHGNWASVRASAMAVCGNPLHRLHAVVQPAGAALDDVLEDACDLVDAMLSIVEDLYGVRLPRVAERKGV